jgi:YfiH family protein
MPFRSNGEVRFYQFELFSEGLAHAIFTRQGGVSPDPWAGLNVGGTVGDDPERVSENRRRALAALVRAPKSVYDAWQVHGVDVAIAEAPRPPETPHPQADIILTDKLGVTLMMRFADCVPVLLHDPVRNVVGIAHAGWMGTVRCTVRAAVEAMQVRFGSKPTDIQAGIGPSIGPDHYQVGSDVVSQVRQTFGPDASGLLAERDGSMFFNLWAANRQLLELAGVKQIEVAGLCTACHTDDWFSHRAERGRTGRFGAIIALSDEP